MALAVITGASGLLGGNLAVELLARGHRVRATRRGRSRIDHLDGRGIEWVEADLADPTRLAGVFEGADVVFHCAALVSIRRRPTPALWAANVDGTRHVIEAAERSRVARLVHCSTVGAVGVSEDGVPVTEEARWNFAAHGLDDGYVITKRRAEELVRAAATRGAVDAVIGNPSYMIGPLDARPSSGQLLLDVARRKVPAWTPGSNNFVDVRDVACGMMLLWERGRRGERYILGGHNLSYRDLLTRIAARAGVAPPALRAPRWLAAAIGRAGDVIERLAASEPMLNSMTMRYAFTDYVFSSDKARRELGYQISPIDGAIADALAWFRERKMLR